MYILALHVLYSHFATEEEQSKEFTKSLRYTTLSSLLLKVQKWTPTHGFTLSQSMVQFINFLSDKKKHQNTKKSEPSLHSSLSCANLWYIYIDPVIDFSYHIITMTERQ